MRAPTAVLSFIFLIFLCWWVLGCCYACCFCCTDLSVIGPHLLLHDASCTSYTAVRVCSSSGTSAAVALVVYCTVAEPKVLSELARKAVSLVQETSCVVVLFLVVEKRELLRE